jgi:hypothetical protein
MPPPYPRALSGPRISLIEIGAPDSEHGGDQVRERRPRCRETAAGRRGHILDRPVAGQVSPDGGPEVAQFHQPGLDGRDLAVELREERRGHAAPHRAPLPGRALAGPAHGRCPPSRNQVQARQKVSSTAPTTIMIPPPRRPG